MIQYNAALKIIEKEFSRIKIGIEKVSLLDSLNRIIAGDIYADTEQPLFTSSAMDGYAFKYAEGINEWKISGEISAGSGKLINVKKGEAVLVTTGSRIPETTDTVIPIEDLIVKENTIKYKNNGDLKRGINVRLQGEDIKKGKLLIRKNTILKSNNIAIAASCGKSIIKVYKKLKIGVLATGDELADINNKPEDDKIRASNLYSLLSAVEQMNMIPVSFGLVKDNKGEIKENVGGALSSGIDILLTTGGVSAGKYDFLIDIFKELGMKIIFSKVNIKPGKPVLFGVYNKNKKTVLVFGLPGNPVSSYVSFILFVRNVIMNKLSLNYNHAGTAILNAALSKQDNKRHFLRGIIQNKNGTNIVSKIGSQSSANIGGLNSANCLIVLKEKNKILKKGRITECIMI
jgi:molybdopterin molybdotransferase